MNYPIDQTSDSGFARLVVLIKQYPELQKVAQHAELDPVEFEKLNANQFAWAGARRFPMHDKGHIALSYGYCKVANSKIPPPVIALLEKAAKLHNLNLNLIFSTQKKQAQDNSYYLLPEYKRFRINEAKDVLIMEKAYHEKYAQLTPDERASAGIRLVAIASKYKIPLSSSTAKLAGFTATNMKKAADWIDARGEATGKIGSSMYKSAFFNLAKELRKFPETVLIDRSEQVKLANIVNYLDKQANLTPFYGKYLLDPLQTIFNTDKLIHEFVKVGTIVYDKKTLEKVPLDFWIDLLGEDITKEIAPNGEIDMDMLMALLPTLPSDIKATLETQLTPYLG